jgi:nucleoside-diphosphate-sugar epimerase
VTVRWPDGVDCRLPAAGAFQDGRCTCADATKLQRHLRWTPQTMLDEGLARQVAWQQAAR